MADDTINTATEFVDRLRGEDEVRVKFRKKEDDSERIMRCTLNFNKVPRNKHPKDVNLSKILNLLHKNKIIHVYDLDKDDWRSIPFDRAEWLETPDNRRFTIKS